MKEVGLIIDLYLSSVLDKEVVKKAVTDFYSPLVRLLKVKKDLKISLNIPLSTLELLDKYGYLDLISDIKDLQEKEKIEIVGASPYNSLLTSFSKEFSENQIILNEYGLGYYLGSKQGFEGESSIMLKGLDGFIPTELIVNEGLINILDDLGYKWVAVDSSLLQQSEKPLGTAFYKIPDKDLIVVGVTNNLVYGSDSAEEYNAATEVSYSRENVIEILEKLIGAENAKVSNIYEKDRYETKVIKLGSNISSGLKNSFKEEFETIETSVEYLMGKNYKLELVRDLIKKHLKDIPEFENETINEVVKYYDSKERRNKNLHEIENKLVNLTHNTEVLAQISDFSVIAMWKDDEIGKIDDEELHNKVSKFILLSKFICIDKYFYLKCVFDKLDSFSYASVLLNLILGYATGFINFDSDISTKGNLSKLVNDFFSGTD